MGKDKEAHSCTSNKCRKPDDEEMVQCEKCRRWWHFDCAKFDPDLYKTVDPWFCGYDDCVEQEVAKPSESSKEGDAKLGAAAHGVDDVESSVDMLIEAAALAQASVSQKDAELAALRAELEETKLKLLNQSTESTSKSAGGSASADVPFDKAANERLQVIRTIQANHRRLLQDGGPPTQSTPVRKPVECNQSFSDSIERSDMSSLLTILNRGNVQELPTFSGENRREWPYFEEVYRSTTVEGKFSGKENVARLRRALKGEAYHLVSDRLKYSSDDVAIMDSLRAIFGRAEVLVHGLTSDLLSLPPLKSTCDSNLHLWAVRVSGFVADLKSLNRNEDLRNGYVLTDLACKLGPSLYQEWRKKQLALPVATLEDFADFLMGKLVDLPPELVKPLPSGASKKVYGTQKTPSRVLTHHPSPSVESGASCGKCGQKQHLLDQCNEFKALQPVQRLAFAREKSLCFACLDPKQHNWRACAQKRTCGVKGCSGRHHPLLHQSPTCEGASLNPAAAPYSPQRLVHSSHTGSNLSVMFKIAPIRLYGNNEKFVDTFAFLDDGSALTMIEQELFDFLNLEGKAEQLTLQWTKGVSRTEESVRTSVEVSGVDNRQRHLLKNVYSVKGLDLPSQTIDVAEVKKAYPHLRGLPLKDLTEAKPQILVGLDQAKFLLERGQRHGKDDEPCALKTLLGWIVYGRSAPSVNVSCLTHAATPTVQLMMHDALKSEDELHDLVKRHFTTEDFGVMAPKGDLISREDKRAVNIMEQTLRFVDQRYEIGLLWRRDNIKLPDSYPMALKRLEGLEKSLKKKPHLLDWMISYMSELLRKGYARLASAEELEFEWPRVWYSPMFIVENPNKVPPKPRVVSDVAAKVNGVSLNTFLLKGPDNLVPLHAGLFKFRERMVAVNADVREMFHQICIRPEDQQCQRFLWRDGDSSSLPKVYIMQVMMFGPRCSPSCAQFVKNYHANSFMEESPEACDGLTNRTYVDDYFNSHDTVEQAAKVTEDAIRICKSMGFDLVGVQSNSMELVSRLPASHVNAKLVSVDPSGNEGLTTKILGMFWLPSRDRLTYKLSDEGLLEKMVSSQIPVTKREILRTVMRVFDPLGLISLYIIRGRIVLQDVWREGFSWEEEVSPQLKLQWLEFVGELRSIESLKIPRHYVSWGPDTSEVSLVIFVDASEKAFAAVAYFRFENLGNVEVALVMAKAKVAPVKTLSVPRLELQAAVLGTRIATTIKNSHSIRIDKIIFLSDSKTVLSWINSTTYKFPSFVAVRVGEILDSTSPRQWFHVRTAENVADDATRWSDSSMRDADSRWFTGPKFLRRAFEEWPVTPSKMSDVDVPLEVRDERVFLHDVRPRENFSLYDELSARFQARWASSIRVIAFFLRLRDKFRREPIDTELFATPREFKQAETWMFRKIQQEAFPEEINSLQTTGRVSMSSSVASLSPFLDEDGTMRLSSRAQKAATSYASRNPAILPKNHPLVDVFVYYHHERNLHMGTANIVSDIREQAWIISIRRVVQRVRSRCYMCKRLRAKPAQPKMGLLPEGRLAFDSRPFTHVGVDCFGPLLVKFGRGTAKRYGMIFTCLTFRAVQIELLNDLSLDQCTMALRRFLINRVVTRFLYSDNGLNFVGAKNQLEKDVKEMQDALCEHSARYEGILWRFIPAYSPWMGGAWERLIQSIKRSVDFILKGVVPREDVLRNTLMEAQGQINRRPLTHMPVDPEDPKPLTPNAMLFGDEDKDPTAPGVFYDNDRFSRLYSRRCQHLMSEFKRRWYREYLPEILRRSKWHKETELPKVGDIVVLIEPNEIRSTWQLGRIAAVYPGPDGIVRTADVQMPNGTIKSKRSMGRLAVLDVQSSPLSSDGPRDVIKPM